MVDKKSLEKFNKGIAKIKLLRKKTKYRYLKIKLLIKIFKKVNINMTKIKFVKKKIKNDRYLNINVTKKNY